MANVRFDEAALDRLLNQPSGPVGKHLRRIGLQILAGGKGMAGVRTGQLHRRMYMSQGRQGRFQHVEVGSKAKYAYYHHEGTKPHRILPKNGRVVRFNVGGRVVYARKVMHPGTRPNPFLTVPMRRAVSR